MNIIIIKIYLNYYQMVNIINLNNQCNGINYNIIQNNKYNILKKNNRCIYIYLHKERK